MTLAADGSLTAGVCHARGGNADLPEHQITYVAVPDLAAGLAKVVESGEEIINSTCGEDLVFVVIKGPVGAVMVLMRSGSAS